MASATTFVDQGDEVAVTAIVETMQQLFEAPELDPFTDQVRTTAVVDDIIDFLHARRLRRPPQVTLTLLLPAAEVRAGLAQEAAAALRRYAVHHLAEAKQALAISTFEGRARLPWGIVIAVAAIAVALLLNALLPDDLKWMVIALTPVVTVIVWVAIWNPTESLLYENWSLRREIALTDILDEIKVEVKAR